MFGAARKIKLMFSLQNYVICNDLCKFCLCDEKEDEILKIRRIPYIELWGCQSMLRVQYTILRAQGVFVFLKPSLGFIFSEN